MQGRIKEFFSRDRKTLYMILSIVLISIFSLTIVYAALSVTLNIQGSAKVASAEWDIHLDNAKVTNGSVSDSIPTISSDGKTATFSTTLNMPGDFYEFSIDVVNDGSIDAMIDSVTKTPTLTTEQAKYLNYIIEYQNGESINTKQLVSKNSSVRLKVRVEFRNDIIASDLPTTSEILNLAFTVNYVQSDGTGTTVPDNGVQKKLINVVSGDGTNTSDEVCIGEECFYVISSTEEIKMLSKMNITLDDSPIQSSSSGTKAFSSTYYWSSTTSAYPAYVYNENSYLYEYVENYKNYLEGLGTSINEARLITMEELEGLGCVRAKSSCSGAPSWVYSTSYWTGAALSSSKMWSVFSDSAFGSYGYTGYTYGVRPVIVIDKSLL